MHAVLYRCPSDSRAIFDRMYMCKTKFMLSHPLLLNISCVRLLDNSYVTVIF